MWTPDERKRKERESPVELRVPWNRLLRRRVHENVLVCAVQRGIDALVQRDAIELDFPTPGLRGCTCRNSKGERRCCTLGAVSRISRPGIAYGSPGDQVDSPYEFSAPTPPSFPFFLFLVSFWNELSLLSTNSLENLLVCSHLLARMYVCTCLGLSCNCFLGNWGSVRNFESYF